MVTGHDWVLGLTAVEGLHLIWPTHHDIIWTLVLALYGQDGRLGCDTILSTMMVALRCTGHGSKPCRLRYEKHSEKGG